MLPLPAQDLSLPTFQVIRDLLRDRTGISLTDQKRSMVSNRLQRRLKARGLADFEGYLSYLKDSGDGAEWAAFTNALTTNLTHFYRETHHFERLVEWAPTQPQPLKIWSAGCSTGEEPYSIALCLQEALGARARFHVRASDIDTQVLEQAREGIYPSEKIAKLPASLLRIGFDDRHAEGGHPLRPEIAERVCFAPHNLLTDPFPERASLDAIFCRNVMIYFDPPTQARLQRGFAGCLREGGLLFLGHSEMLWNPQDLGLRSLGRSAYERLAP